MRRAWLSAGAISMHFRVIGAQIARLTPISTLRSRAQRWRFPHEAIRLRRGRSCPRPRFPRCCERAGPRVFVRVIFMLQSRAEVQRNVMADDSPRTQLVDFAIVSEAQVWQSSRDLRAGLPHGWALDSTVKADGLSKVTFLVDGKPRDADMEIVRTLLRTLGLAPA